MTSQSWLRRLAGRNQQHGSRDQVRLIETVGIARGSDGKALISPELYLSSTASKRSTKTKATCAARDGEQGSTLRKDIAITRSPAC